MKGYQDTFQRYELKYLVDEDQYRRIKNKVKDKLKADEYGNTTICNIYFDTPDRQLVRTSLEKPVYKEKLRLRSYGVPEDGDKVFVEIKKKYKGIVYKRREKLELKTAEDYLYDDIPLLRQTQITKEIDWFLRSYQDLEPAMYISYHRIAMYGMEDPELRVTFDSDILWREEELWLGCGEWGNPILDEGIHLMEIKIPGTMPLWLAHLLDELKIYPASFSKYGNAYLLSELQKNKTKNEGVKLYA